MKRLQLTLGTLGAVGLTAAIVFTQQPNAQGQAVAQDAPAAQAPPGQGPGGGGRGAPPAPPQNLQVLPKTMTTPEVQAYMQGVAAGLGVQCSYCHPAAPAPPPPPDGAAAPPPGRGGRGGPQLDFVSDDKQEKKTARLMIKLVNDLNAAVPTGVNKPAMDTVQVQCVTCHRGVTKPAQLTSVLSQVMLTKGEGAAIAKYRELRAQYYGTQAYDFTEPTLTRLAQQSLATNKPDDALAWAKLNLEFYPKSAQSYVALSQVHARKNDRATAIKDLEQAVALDPDNMQIKRQLDQLKSPTPPSQ